MADEAQLQNSLNGFHDWVVNTFWDVGTAYQLIIVAVAIVLGSFATGFMRKPVANAIDSSSLSPSFKKNCHSLRKLTLPFITLVLTFFASQIAGSELLALDIAFLKGVMKLLLAWIFIRSAVLLINNSLIRNFFALFIWIIAALSIFNVLDETTATLDAIGMDLGEFRLSALAVIKGVMALFVLLYGAIVAAGFAERRIYKTSALTRSSQVLIAKIVRTSLIVFALLIGVTSAGIDLSLFAVFGGAVGLGVGFGLQKGISNLFSGMLLLLDKSIKPGDIIELEGGMFGWVDRMGARYTEIVTRDNKSFLIPNEDFITQRVVNWSHANTLIRLEVQFGVDYRHNPHEIKRLAEEAAMKPERVCSDQPPVCHLAEFGESSMNFKLRFWIQDAEKGVTNMRGEVMLALWDIFQENNIKIPYPHREVYIREKAA